MNELLKISLEQGIIFSILGMGVYISFRIIKLVDLTVEGAFPFGAFVFAKFVTMGLSAELRHNTCIFNRNVSRVINIYFA